MKWKPRGNRSYRTGWAGYWQRPTDATPPLTLIFPITRSDCQLQIRHLATALLPDNGQRIQIVAKKEQEERTGQDDLNLARLLTQI